MRPATLAALAAKYAMEMPIIRGYGSFSAFSDLYVAATAVLRTPQDWERLADELCEDHAGDGAVYWSRAFGQPTTAISLRPMMRVGSSSWPHLPKQLIAAVSRWDSWPPSTGC